MKIQKDRIPSPRKRKSPNKEIPVIKVAFKTKPKSTVSVTPPSPKFEPVDEKQTERITPPTKKYELSSWEKELLKRKQIIRTDGYIPNSVIRRRFNVKKRARTPTPDKPKDLLFEALRALQVNSPLTQLYQVYKPLHPIGKQQEAKKGHAQELEHKQAPPQDIYDDDSREPTPFIWTEAEDEDDDLAEKDEELQATERKSTSALSRQGRQKIVRASSTSSKRGYMSGGRTTPVTPKLSVKPKQYDFVRGELHSATPDLIRAMRRSGGSRNRERTSFNLTNIVVDEDSTQVRYKKAGKIVGLTDMSSVQELMNDPLFSDLSKSASLDTILQALLKRMEENTETLNNKLCKYVLLLQREIGIPHIYLGSIVNKLVSQLDECPTEMALEIINALKEVGGGRQDVIAAILPKLLDGEPEVRKAAAAAIADLAGDYNDKDMLQLIQADVKSWSSAERREEIEALKALAKRLNVKLKPSHIIMSEFLDDDSRQYSPSFSQDEDFRTCDSRAYDSATQDEDMSIFLGSVPETPLALDSQSEDNSEMGILDYPEKSRGGQGGFMWNRLSLAGMTADVEPHPGAFLRRLLPDDTRSLDDDDDDDEDEDAQTEIQSVMKELDVMRLQSSRNENLQQTVLHETTAESSFNQGSESHSNTDTTKRYRKRANQRSFMFGSKTGMDSKRSALVFPVRHPISPKSDSLSSETSSRLTTYSRADRIPWNSEDDEEGLYPVNKEIYSDSDIQTPEQDIPVPMPVRQLWVEEVMKRHGYSVKDDTDEEHQGEFDELSNRSSPVMSSIKTENKLDDETSLASLRLEGFAIEPKPPMAIPNVDEPLKQKRKENFIVKRPLSPVTSLNSFSLESSVEIPTPRKPRKLITPPPDWRKFFETPTAQERKRKAMLKRDIEMGKTKKTSGTTIIHYIGDDPPVIPLEAGLRVLHTVRVADKRQHIAHNDKHNIRAIPGKLAIDTKSEHMGNSKYGVIQMQWTTGLPVNYITDEMTSSDTESSCTELSNLASNSSNSTLPPINKSFTNQQSSDELISFKMSKMTSHSQKGLRYRWEKPLPPPPGRESRKDIESIRNKHRNYCEQYDRKAGNKPHQLQMPSEKRTIMPVAYRRVPGTFSDNQTPKSRFSRVQGIILPPVTLKKLLRVSNWNH